MTKKFLANVLVFLLAIGAIGGYLYANDKLFAKPCTRPIEFSIDRFDSRFGISQEQFLDAVNLAALTWSDSVQKDLFRYVPLKGSLKINLIYDYRQQATEKLEDLGINISDSKSSYDSLKVRYDSMVTEYNLSKKVYDSKIADYEGQKQAYEQSVNYWNSRGGAPKSEAIKLNAQAESLNALAVQSNQRREAINDAVNNINILVVTLNRLGHELNLNVEDYNSIGQSRGEEFEEGLFVQQGRDKHIDIYEFSDQSKLVRVLAHELGHALGLEHVDDPDAIMYKLNQSKNERLTVADLVEIKQLCGVSP